MDMTCIVSKSLFRGFSSFTPPFSLCVYNVDVFEFIGPVSSWVLKYVTGLTRISIKLFHHVRMELLFKFVVDGSLV